MPAPIRYLAVAAALVMLARPALGQQTPQTPPTPPTPNVHVAPFPPQAPDIEKWGKWGERWGAFGESLGVLGDSLGRLGATLGELEASAASHATAHQKAAIDSLKRAMSVVEHQMSRQVRHRSGPGWDQRANFRDMVRQARESARRAVDEAARQRVSPMVQVRTGNAAVAQLLDRVRQDPEAIPLPSADSFTVGGLTVAAGSMRAGVAAAVNGDLDVYGMVDGNAIAIDGNVNVHRGGHVSGTAFAAGGEVQIDSGGMVDGEIRSLQGDFGPLPVVASTRTIAPTNSRWHSVKLAITAFAMLLVLGIGVLTFAEDQLDNVTATLADRFGRSAWYGVVGEIALGPVLLALVIALCITVVGIVVVPFAIVGYTAIAVGAGTLGFMAVAEATGTAVLRSQTQASLSPRGAQLRAIVTGISIYGGMWVVTAIVGADTGAGIAVRVIALVVTGVAVTVGFGAVLLWRFDLRRAKRLGASVSSTPADEALWQTPTPVAGVAAARRPASAASSTPGGST
jgi:hypothetical protein